MKIYVVFAVYNTDPPYPTTFCNVAFFKSKEKAELFLDDLIAIKEIEEANRVYGCEVEYGVGEDELKD